MKFDFTRKKTVKKSLFVEDPNNPIIKELNNGMKKYKANLTKNHFDLLPDWTIYELLDEMINLKILSDLKNSSHKDVGKRAPLIFQEHLYDTLLERENVPSKFFKKLMQFANNFRNCNPIEQPWLFRMG